VTFANTEALLSVSKCLQLVVARLLMAVAGMPLQETVKRERTQAASTVLSNLYVQKFPVLQMNQFLFLVEHILHLMWPTHTSPQYSPTENA